MEKEVVRNDSIEAGVDVDVGGGGWKKRYGAVAFVRTACVLTSVTAVCVMTTAEQASTLSLYGLTLPLYSKWTFADSFVYLAAVSAAVAVYSLLHLLIIASRILQKSPPVTRRHGWLLFAGDQIFAYATISAGSAASGVTSLNRTGIRHSALPNFCNPLYIFCGRVAISIGFVFLAAFFLAISVILDVIEKKNESCITIRTMATNSLVLLTVAVFIVAAAAEEFEVGGELGWRNPPAGRNEVYAQWASGKRFRVGDSLRFKYGSNDSVEAVDKVGYYHCNSSSPISVYTDGDTVVVLGQPGPAYFASGDEGHCQNGQRLLVEVMGDRRMHIPPAPSPSSAVVFFPTALQQLASFLLCNAIYRIL
ncbi:hypothetical protein M569_12482 [Genlisea aurea]|uniref:CASP-like protein n=1 Tax=Genlisea aurea TaxID=192259 RepID=S8DHJ5_9LAMI|nr:hypothetical protein M569_12482 [Genlisea aurea]